MYRASVLLLAVAGCQPENQFRRLEKPPEVTIVTPILMEVFRKGEGTLPFSGTAEDSFDEGDGLDATWILDGGEPVSAPVLDDGTVAWDLDPEPLALGEHLLQLRVVDSDGMEDEAEVTWVLDGALTGPLVQITAPVDGTSHLPGAEITFRGEATDNNTDPADLVFAWTSSVDGVIPDPISGDGQSVVFSSTLSLGVHEILLTVTDKDGELGTDAITVTIAEEVIDPPIEPEPPVQAQVGDLVFSELFVNPSVVDDEVGEWVELYNTSSSPIEIAGYSFHDLDYDSYTIVGSTIVAPFDYVVLCADVDPLVNGGVPCDVPFVRLTGGAGAMALGNDGDEVVLSRPDGIVIDQVLYDGTWFTPAVATGLDPTQLDADNNDDETMWCDQTSIPAGGSEPGTPGTVNDPC